MSLMAEREAPPTRTNLSDVVSGRRKELRLSLRAVQDRTADPDSGEPLVKYGWLDRLEKNSTATPPSLEQLKALAMALEMPLGRLQDAAGAQFFGIDTVWSASGEARALVERADKMTPAQREQLARLLDTFTSDG